MKLFMVLICLCFITPMCFGEGQEYEVIYKVKYNSITLERAAEIDRQIRKQYDDSCDVDTNIEEIDTGRLYFTTVSSQ